MATPVIARFYEELADILPEGTGVLCPPHEEIEALLAKGGAPISPKEIGISRELFHEESDERIYGQTEIFRIAVCEG